jgi:citrate lyase gamma subunit
MLITTFLGMWMSNVETLEINAQCVNVLDAGWIECIIQGTVDAL